jgi:hypothetical protein
VSDKRPRCRYGNVAAELLRLHLGPATFAESAFKPPSRPFDGTVEAPYGSGGWPTHEARHPHHGCARERWARETAGC